jgi:ADP-heptose:LPS heptosyltransferase
MNTQPAITEEQAFEERLARNLEKEKAFLMYVTKQTANKRLTHSGIKRLRKQFEQQYKPIIIISPRD